MALIIYYAHHLLVPNNFLASLVVITLDLNGRFRSYLEVNYMSTRYVTVFRIQCCQMSQIGFIEEFSKRCLNVDQIRD